MSTYAYAGRPGSLPFSFNICPGGVRQQIRHWPVLAFLEGDLQMMYKLMLTVPHSAIHGCPRCAVSGQHLGGAVRSVSPGLSTSLHVRSGPDPHTQSQSLLQATGLCLVRRSAQTLRLSCGCSMYREADPLSRIGRVAQPFTSRTCRFPFFEQSPQDVPRTKKGERVMTVHEDDDLASVVGVPAGYCGETPAVNRSAIPPAVEAQLRLGDPQSIEEYEVAHGERDELLYTGLEMHARAQAVQAAWDKSVAAVIPPLQELEPPVRKKRWKSLITEASVLSKERGVHGLSNFSRLSYFRYAPPVPSGVHP